MAARSRASPSWSRPMADSGSALATLSAIHVATPHDSAAKHVAGEAIYIDDLPEPTGLLHLHVGQSARAHARVTRLDLSAVRAAPGVVCVLTSADVPGRNDIGPVQNDEPLLPEGVVRFVGQPLFVVAAESLPKARAAAALAIVDYEDLPSLLTIEAALAANSLIEDTQTMRLGDARAAIAAAPHALSGKLAIGGQDHFYLEGQVALVVPGEDGDLHVWSSTQNPTETQHLIARTLGLRDNAVVVEVRRMGGAFGGKETQSVHYAAIAA